MICASPFFSLSLTISQRTVSPISGMTIFFPAETVAVPFSMESIPVVVAKIFPSISMVPSPASQSAEVDTCVPGVTRLGVIFFIPVANMARCRSHAVSLD